MVTRYEIHASRICTGGALMISAEDGGWVTYSDHAAEVARLSYALAHQSDVACRNADAIARLTRERDEAISKSRDMQLVMIAHDQEMDGWEQGRDEVLAERDSALAEIARMRPVVEAAERWFTAEAPLWCLHEAVIDYSAQRSEP